MQLTKETALIELADAILIEKSFELGTSFLGQHRFATVPTLVLSSIRRSESVQYRLDEEPGEGQLWEGIHNATYTVGEFGKMGRNGPLPGKVWSQTMGKLQSVKARPSLANFEAADAAATNPPAADGDTESYSQSETGPCGCPT